MKDEPLLEMRNVGKDFDGNVVLKDISFTLRKGQILGLCGENGAGKSTLMNILFGMDVIRETGGYTGEVLIDGKKVDFKKPLDALYAGLGMVHQEFSLIPGFSVAENIMLNREPSKGNVISKIFGKHGKKLETVDKEQIRSIAESALSKMGVELEINSPVSEMPVGHKQFIEIAREISKIKTRLLILDEPTAVLTESEADILLQSMKKLSENGIAIIFISHRLREILEVCDKVLVMRDGLVVDEKDKEETNILEIARKMVGRNVESTEDFSKNKSKRQISDEVILSMKNFWVDMPGEAVRNVNLEVHKGEILGIAGLAGQGKLGIANGLMGIYEAGGEVLYKGEPFSLNNTKYALEHGFAFVSEDRRGVGLLLDEPISWNILFNALQIKNVGIRSILGGLFKFRDDKTMDKIAREYIDKLEIRCTGPGQKVRNLSGGNQQKICLSKAFCLDPEILLVSEPTRGIDVGAKELVLEALRKYNSENGTTIIIVSSELEELRSISDRIAVTCEGEIFGILPPQAKPEDFGLLMSGEKIEEVGA